MQDRNVFVNLPEYLSYVSSQ